MFNGFWKNTKTRITQWREEIFLKVQNGEDNTEYHLEWILRRFKMRLLHEKAFCEVFYERYVTASLDPSPSLP